MNTIQTTLSIDGMTCGHCVKSVQKALAAIPGVRTVDVQLANGTATVVHDGVATGVLTEAIVRAGYTVPDLTPQ